MNPQDRHREYISYRVMTASPLELIRILYDAAVQAVGEAIAALHVGDVLTRGNAISKAIEILAELQLSLRRDVREEYSNTLDGLYSYMQRQLIRAHAEKSEDLLLEVSRLLNTLLDGWAGAMENLDALHAGECKTDLIEPAPAPNASNPYSGEPADSTPRSRTWQL